MSDNDAEGEFDIPKADIDVRSFYYSSAVLRCLRRLGLGVAYPFDALLYCKEESLAESPSGEISEYRSRLQAVELLKNKKNTHTKSTRGIRNNGYYFFLQFRELLIFLLSEGDDYLGDWRDLYGSTEYDNKKRIWTFSTDALNDESGESLWNDSHFNSPRVAADSFLVQIHPVFRRFVGQELRGRILAKAQLEFLHPDFDFLHPNFFKFSMDKQIEHAIERSLEIGLLRNWSFKSGTANVHPEKIATVCLNLPTPANVFIRYCNGIAIEASNEVLESREDEYDLLRLFRGHLRWKKNILLHGYKLPEGEAFVRLIGKPSGRKTIRALKERYLISSAHEIISDSDDVLQDVLSQLFSSTEERYSVTRKNYFEGTAEDVEESWLSLCEWKNQLDDWEDALDAIIPWTATSLSLFDSLRWFRLNVTPNNAAIAVSFGLSPCVTPNVLELAGLEVNVLNLRLWNPLVTERIHFDEESDVARTVSIAVAMGFPDAESFLATKGNGLTFADVERLTALSDGSIPPSLLHRFDEFLNIGLPNVLAVQLSQIEHITAEQALELSHVMHPIEVILKFTKAIKNHSTRIKWLTAPPHVDLNDGFAYALDGITLTRYMNIHMKR